MYSRERTVAVGPKDKAGGCSYEKLTGSEAMESFQSFHGVISVGKKQWEKRQMEKEDQKKFKAVGVLEPLWKLQPKNFFGRDFSRPCFIVTGFEWMTACFIILQ